MRYHAADAAGEIVLTRARARAPAVWRVAAAAVVVALFAVFLVWPLVALVAASVRGPHGVTLAHYAALFGAWPLVAVILRTLLLGALAALVTVCVALVLAVVVVRTDAAARRLASLALVLPALAPPFVGALVLLLVFGPGGLARDWAPGWRGGLAPLLAAQVLTFVPAAFLLVARLVAGVDPALEEVAESLGATRLAAFRRVTLAAIRPGLVAVALVVGALSVADVADPLLVGGGYRVLGAEIYERAMGGRVESAAAMAVVLALGCLLGWIVGRPWTTLPVPPAPLASPCAVPPRRFAPLAWWILGAVAAAAALAVVGAFALVIGAALVPGWLAAPGHSSRLGGDAGRALATSVAVALVAGVAGTVVAMAAATASAGREGASRAGNAVLLVAIAAPGPAVGLGYVLAFGAGAGPWARWRWLASVVVWYLPLGILAARAAFERVDRRTLAAASGLGATSRDLLARILAPILAPAAGWIFVYFFASAMVTVNALVFLVPVDDGLAAIAALHRAQRGMPAAACALVVAITVVTVAVATLLFAASRRGRRPAPVTPTG